MNNFMPNRPGFYEEITGGAGDGAGNYQPPESSNTNNNGGGDEDHLLLRPSGSHVVEREHMFDKVVTPSDVGKLNRLVIPKQHAEKYFPLDSSTNEKGLLLNFEDRNGKPWRFRYSYWNSSQSYVMTKGWSRFVKEKKLDAGDIVSFQRGVGESGKDRLFIDWRRRPDAPDLLSPQIPHHFSSFQYRSSTHPWNPLFFNPPRTEYSPYQNQFHHHHHHQNHNPYGINYGFNNNSTVVNGNPCPPGSIFYLRSGNTGGAMASGGGSGIIVAGRPQQDGSAVHVGGGVYDSVPVVHGKVAAKRLRLFGVNMDCPISESDECEMVSNSTMRLHQYFPPATLSPSSSSSIPNSLQYSGNNEDDKGKGSMSLDLDI